MVKYRIITKTYADGKNYFIAERLYGLYFGCKGWISIERTYYGNGVVYNTKEQAINIIKKDYEEWLSTKLLSETVDEIYPEVEFREI